MTPSARRRGDAAFRACRDALANPFAGCFLFDTAPLELRSGPDSAVSFACFPDGSPKSTSQDKIRRDAPMSRREAAFKASRPGRSSLFFPIPQTFCLFVPCRFEACFPSLDLQKLYAATSPPLRVRVSPWFVSHCAAPSVVFLCRRSRRMHGDKGARNLNRKNRHLCSLWRCHAPHALDALEPL